MSGRLLVGVLCLAAAGAAAQPAPAVRARVDALTAAALEAPSPAETQALAEEALALAQEAGYLEGVGDAQYAQAYAHYLSGQRGADRLFDEAAATARRAGDARTEGVALAWQGVAVGEDDRARGIAIGRRAVAVHRAMPGDAGRRAELVSLNLLANQYDLAGEPAAAARLHRRIVEAGRALGDLKSVGLSALLLGDAALEGGDLLGALGHYAVAEEAARAATADGAPPGWATDVDAGQARVDAALGRTDRAAAVLRRLAEAEMAAGAAGYASGYYHLLGGVYQDAGRTAPAVAAYRAGRAAVAASEYASYRFEFDVLAAAALFDAGHADEARRALRPAADSVVADPPGPAAEALALTLLARDARLGGRPTEAAALAARALAVADGARLLRPTRDALAEQAAALEAAGDPAGALAAFRRSAALTDSLRSTEQARAVGRFQAEAAFADERATDRQRRARLLWGLISVLGLGAVAAAGGGLYVRTVRRQRAEIARQAAALADANADLAQTNAVVREAREAQARFFQTAGHELRTPLTLTLGPLDDLLRGRHGALDPPARRAADLAHVNAARLARLVDDLLEAARLDAGQTPHHPASTDLGALVAEAAHRFQSHAERDGVALEVHLPEAPVAAIVDAATVERALGNLVANALRHTPSGGRVTVALTTGDGEVRVAVTDTGAGVPAELQARLFERFYRADERAGVGSGLGLALAKEWMERHGGRVELASAPGEGATFTLVLPLAAAVAPFEAEVPGAEVPEDDALLVLVAEDHADLRAYVAAHLGHGLGEAVRVVQAADGDAALDLALELVPDLVVSDVMMPGLDGFELTRALKADRRTSHVPVLLLTARADAPGVVAGFEAGADGYLAKPFDADVLRAQAAGLIAERRRLRERAQAVTGGDGHDGDGHTGAVGVGAGGRGGARSEPDPPQLAPADRAFLDVVDATIAAHVGDALFGAEALAEALALSPRQLRRKLRALAADSPVARLRRARVAAAEALLAEGHPLAETARAVGYADGGGLRRALAAVEDERGR